MRLHRPPLQPSGTQEACTGSMAGAPCGPDQPLFGTAPSLPFNTEIV